MKYYIKVDINIHDNFAVNFFGCEKVKSVSTLKCCREKLNKVLFNFCWKGHVGMKPHLILAQDKHFIAI